MPDTFFAQRLLSAGERAGWRRGTDCGLPHPLKTARQEPGFAAQGQRNQLAGDPKAQGERQRPPVMFAQKKNGRAHFMEVFEGSGLLVHNSGRAFPPMPDGRLPAPVKHISGLARPQAKIMFLIVEEKSFIQQTYIFHQRQGKSHARAVYIVHCGRSGHVFRPGQGRTGPENGGVRRKTASQGQFQPMGPVPAEDGCTYDGAGMRFQAAPQQRGGIGSGYGIVVQKPGVLYALLPGMTQTRVAGGGEPPVFSHFENCRTGGQGITQAACFFSTAVADEDDQGTGVTCRQRGQAASCGFRGTVMHDDAGQG